MLAVHTPKNVTKSRKTRGAVLPPGPSHYVLNSPEYVDILTDHAVAADTKKPKKIVPTSTVVSGSSGSQEEGYCKNFSDSASCWKGWPPKEELKSEGVYEI